MVRKYRYQETGSNPIHSFDIQSSKMEPFLLCEVQIQRGVGIDRPIIHFVFRVGVHKLINVF